MCKGIVCHFSDYVFIEQRNAKDICPFSDGYGAIAQIDGFPKPVNQDKERLTELHPIVEMYLSFRMAILQHHLGLRVSRVQW